jgi:transposase InsO family protein
LQRQTSIGCNTLLQRDILQPLATHTIWLQPVPFATELGLLPHFLVVAQGLEISSGDDLGIGHQFSPTYTPQSNGVVERKNRTLIDMARSMLSEYNVSHSFWSEAINTACYCSKPSLLPWEAWEDTI